MTKINDSLSDCNFQLTTGQKLVMDCGFDFASGKTEGPSDNEKTVRSFFHPPENRVICSVKKKVLTVVGTRPNFIKITQFDRAFSAYPEEFEHKVVHTGQHYDQVMSQVFFDQLGLREPDYYLGVTESNPAAQMGRIQLALADVIVYGKPDLVMVVGDVNSTLAAALTAHKLGVPIAHVESGLRSFDRTMPEEVNRILTDEMAELFFVTEKSGETHLLNAGKRPEQLHFVGNTMIDTLVAYEEAIAASPVLDKLGITGDYVLTTMHRPSNVDTEEDLKKMIAVIRHMARDLMVVFPIHPRTRKRLQEFGLWPSFEAIDNLVLSPPLDYLAFQHLIANCTLVLTDSGGIQEETTFRQVPCLTLRENTERPSTIELGTNELVPFDPEVIAGYVDQIRNGTYKKGQIPPLWDGKATERIVEVLRKVL